MVKKIEKDTPHSKVAKMVTLGSSVVHLSKICQALGSCPGHVMTTGAWGIGQDALLELSATVMKQLVHTVALSSETTLENWRADINLILLEAGIDAFLKFSAICPVFFFHLATAA